MKNWYFGKSDRINRPQEMLTQLKRKHTNLDIKNNVVYHCRGNISQSPRHHRQRTTGYQPLLHEGEFIFLWDEPLIYYLKAIGQS